MKTRTLTAHELASGHVIVGDSGGTSMVHEKYNSSVMRDMYAVETEHGTLYMDMEETLTVLDGM